MKKSLVLGSALALVLAASSANAAITTYKATLNGAQEVPAVATAATGTATLTYNDANQRLQGTITFTGLANVNNQHIHIAACGVSGAPAVTLDNPNGNTIAVNETLSNAEETALIAGNAYINLHTALHGGGEIRGQLYLDGSGKTCPATVDGGADGGDGGDAGDAGSSGSSGSSGTSGSSGASGSSGLPTGSSNGATTTPAEDAGTGEEGGGDDGGCSTTGAGSSGTGLAFGALAVLGLALAARSRNKKR